MLGMPICSGMKGRNSARGVVATVIGVTLSVPALAVAVYAVLLGGSTDRKCIDNYWCPPFALNAAAVLGFVLGGLVALGAVVAGGIGIVRDPLARRGWLLAGGGAVLAVGVVLAELYYAGQMGAFS